MRLPPDLSKPFHRQVRLPQQEHHGANFQAPPRLTPAEDRLVQLSEELHFLTRISFLQRVEVTTASTMVMYMDIANSVLELIGRPPMVRLVRVTEGIPCPVIAKVETTNPGGSVKDRPALAMIEEAEKEGLLKPG